SGWSEPARSAKRGNEETRKRRNDETTKRRNEELRMATIAQDVTGELRGQPAGSLAAADLRTVIASLEADGQLRRVAGADWDLELGAITEMMALRDGPALLFDGVKGYPNGYSVLTNLM